MIKKIKDIYARIKYGLFNLKSDLEEKVDKSLDTALDAAHLVETKITDVREGVNLAIGKVGNELTELRERYSELARVLTEANDKIQYLITNPIKFQRGQRVKFGSDGGIILTISIRKDTESGGFVTEYMVEKNKGGMEKLEEGELIAS